MDKDDLMLRTKTFSLNVIKLAEGLPVNKANNVIGYQLLKCSTSVGANYREALRAESKADFIHKIGIVEKEASESEWWLELHFRKGTTQTQRGSLGHSVSVESC